MGRGGKPVTDLLTGRGRVPWSAPDHDRRRPAPEVWAESYSNEMQPRTARFEIGAYLEQAPEEVLVLMAKCGWGDDVQTRYVLLWGAKRRRDRRAASLLEYCDKRGIGFDCRIRRPRLWQRLYG
jgi:hypothetical protein